MSWDPMAWLHWLLGNRRCLTCNQWTGRVAMVARECLECWDVRCWRTINDIKATRGPDAARTYAVLVFKFTALLLDQNLRR